MSIFGASKREKELNAELDALRAHIAEIGADDALELAANVERLDAEKAALDANLMHVRGQIGKAQDDLAAVKSEIIETRDIAILQEVGIYEYTHPLDSAEQYKQHLKELVAEYKRYAKNLDLAVPGGANWTMNGSLTKGKRMVTQQKKIMLRAFNVEADNLVRTLTAYKLDSSRDRLARAKRTIDSLGTMMQLTLSPDYVAARTMELELTADFLMRKAEEKEAERERRAQAREEAKAQAEYQREIDKYDKELAHLARAREQETANNDHDAVARLDVQIADAERARAEMEYRKAHTRMGTVYVISNIGAFGEGIVKIGLTRRLDPLERVRELGDASVPFHFDVHVLHFSKDAVGIETAMHQRFADKRVNMVNGRKEFFHVTPREAYAALTELDGEILDFVEEPLAEDFRMSRTLTVTTA